MKRVLTALAACLPFAAHAADAIAARLNASRNWQAIMYLIFVVCSGVLPTGPLKRGGLHGNYYTAGGNMPGLRLAIAGGYMSAA